MLTHILKSIKQDTLVNKTIAKDMHTCRMPSCILTQKRKRVYSLIYNVFD